jgi:hypothetical protein
MRLAIVVVDDRSTLALTAENEFERAALKAFHEVAGQGCVVQRGEFYYCHGGWMRQGCSSEDSLLVVANRRDA